MIKQRFNIQVKSNTAKIEIYGDITNDVWFDSDVTPKKISDQIDKLPETVNIINVYVNSYGGDVFAGLAIHNILKRKSATCTVNIIIDGIAASAASVIAMAGRVKMPKNAMMMIHNPWTIAVGDSEELKKVADTLDKIGLAVIEAYKAKAGLEDEKIQEIMKQESWLTAQECLDTGFCDEILDQEVEIEMKSGTIHLNKECKNKQVEEKGHEKESKTMDVRQLCINAKLDYQALVDAGLDDEKIKSIALSILSRKPESPGTGAENINDTLEIISLCQAENVDPKPYLEKKCSIESVKAAIYDKKQADFKAVASGRVEIIEEETDKFVNKVVDSIMLKGRQPIKKPVEGANEYRNMSLKEIAMECALRTGVSNPHKLSSMELFKLALTPDSQFASILSNAANKSATLSYGEASFTYEMWTQKGTLGDFKAATHYKISESGELEKVAQSGEVKRRELSDEGVSRTLATYATSWGFTFQAFVNDDIGLITSVPAKMIRAAGRGINTLVYRVLGDTSLNIYDNTALFTSGHGNLAGTAAALSVTSLALAEAGMGLQKDLSGNAYLNLTPAYLIVPRALKRTAQQLVGSVGDPAKNSSSAINPFYNDLQVISDAALDGYSSTAWYLAANPMDVDTIEVANLNGQDVPRIEAFVQADTLGILNRIDHSYVVTALEYKGLYKNAGT